MSNTLLTFYKQDFTEREHAECMDIGQLIQIGWTWLWLQEVKTI